MAEIDDQPFPQGILIGAGMLVLASLVAVGASRIGLLPGADDKPIVAASAREVSHAELDFADREDGAVIITSATGREVVIPPATGGFVRGVVRGLARDRRARGIGREPGFRLAKWSDGKLTLTDTATGQRLELDGFGPTNRQAFDDLLRDATEGA